jgi:hypothetical protein
MTKSWIDAATAQVKELTPKTGFNVVAVDASEKPGDALYLVGHFDDAAAAEKARAAHQAKSKNIAYVYPSAKARKSK